MEPTQSPMSPPLEVKPPVSYGPAIREPQETIQINRRSEEGAAADVGGPFCKVFKDGETWMLLGGVVSGGDGNETIEDVNIHSPRSDGTFYWLKANFTAEVEDEVLLPGGELTSTTKGNGSSLPSNKMPTAALPAGFVYIPLGEWMDDVFTPSGCGNIHLTHCPGNLSYSRI